MALENSCFSPLRGEEACETQLVTPLPSWVILALVLLSSHSPKGSYPASFPSSEVENYPMTLCTFNKHCGC